MWWIYENLGVSRGRIHKDYCSRCKYGEGQHRKRGGKMNKWHGPFENKNEVVSYARSLRKADMAFCKYCSSEEVF